MSLDSVQNVNGSLLLILQQVNVCVVGYANIRMTKNGANCFHINAILK